jgi:hypothetical protein
VCLQTELCWEIMPRHWVIGREISEDLTVTDFGVLQLTLAVVRAAKRRMSNVLIKNTLGRILRGELIQLYSLVLSICLELFINLTSDLLYKKRLTNGD